MLDVILALAMQAPDPCHAVGPAPRPATCRQWRPLDRDGGAELFIDPASVRRDSTGFELATRIVFATPQGEEGMRSGVTTNRFDCAARTWALRHSAYYDGDGGLIVEGQSRGEEADPEPVPPGTPMAAVLTEYCAR